MDRKNCYAFLKANPSVAKAIKEAEGINYTNLKTEILAQWCTQVQSHREKASKKEEASVKAANSSLDILGRLIEVLRNKRLIINSEYHYILGN